MQTNVIEENEICHVIDFEFFLKNESKMKNTV